MYPPRPCDDRYLSCTAARPRLAGRRHADRGGHQRADPRRDRRGHAHGTQQRQPRNLDRQGAVSGRRVGPAGRGPASQRARLEALRTEHVPRSRPARSGRQRHQVRHQLDGPVHLRHDRYDELQLHHAAGQLHPDDLQGHMARARHGQARDRDEHHQPSAGRRCDRACHQRLQRSGARHERRRNRTLQHLDHDVR